MNQKGKGHQPFMGLSELGANLPQFKPTSRQTLKKEADCAIQHRREQDRLKGMIKRNLDARNAQDSVIDFIKYSFRQYRRETWHHHLVAWYFQQAVEGKITRLMVFAPPRHMKTESEERAISFALGQNPNEKIIICGFGAARAHTISDHIHTTVTDPRFQQVFSEFPGINGKDTQEFWEIGAGYLGYVRAAGVGGAITGQGFDLGIIDDPHKSREEAESSTYQDKTFEWYEGTFLNRQDEATSRIILTMTRWNNKDLAGRILERDGIISYNGHKPKQGCPEWNGDEEPENGWHILSLPALMDEEAYPWKHGPIMLPRDQWKRPNVPEYATFQLADGTRGNLCDPRELGEALWPSRFGEVFLRQFQVNKHDWYSLYQQRPQPKGGNMINRTWFPLIERLPAPELDCIVRFWDIAATKPSNKNKDPDYTAGALMGLYKGNYYLLDLVTARGTPAEIDALMLRTASQDEKRWGSGVFQFHEKEGGSAGPTAADHYKALFKGAGFEYGCYKPQKSKEFYIERFAGDAERGCVFILNGHWIHERHGNSTFFDEAEAFPKGLHDDRIDAVGKARYVLNEILKSKAAGHEITGTAKELVEKPAPKPRPIRPVDDLPPLPGGFATEMALKQHFNDSYRIMYQYAQRVARGGQLSMTLLDWKLWGAMVMHLGKKAMDGNKANPELFDRFDKEFWRLAKLAEKETLTSVWEEIEIIIRQNVQPAQWYHICWALQGRQLDVPYEDVYDLELGLKAVGFLLKDKYPERLAVAEIEYKRLYEAWDTDALPKNWDAMGPGY